MKKYETPKLDIVELKVMDIMAASTGLDDGVIEFGLQDLNNLELYGQQ